MLRHVTATSSDPRLLVGLEAPDDAAVYVVAPDQAIVQTVDFFTPVVDDPYDWGRITAANALSDVYAMGARPVTALNLVGWPRGLDFELLGLVLDGAMDVCRQAGTAIVGGHSVDDPEPKFGLAVTGLVHPDRIVRNSTARPGAELVLTKPLGMGIISSGIKDGKTSEVTRRRATEVMATLNRAASEAMVSTGVQAATDVTGFGLIGHLLEMLAGRSDAHLNMARVPRVEEALELAAQGVLPGGSKRNRETYQPFVQADGLSEPELDVLFDAQTSGGLLIAVDPTRLDALLVALSEGGVQEVSPIGTIGEGSGRVIVSA